MNKKKKEERDLHRSRAMAFTIEAGVLTSHTMSAGIAWSPPLVNTLLLLCPPSDCQPDRSPSLDTMFYPAWGLVGSGSS